MVTGNISVIVEKATILQFWSLWANLGLTWVVRTVKKEKIRGRIHQVNSSTIIGPEVRFINQFPFGKHHDAVLLTHAICLTGSTNWSKLVSMCGQTYGLG